MVACGVRLQIDWATWESTIQRPGLVAAFKAAHQSVPVLKCESPFTAELEAGFAKLVRTFLVRLLAMVTPMCRPYRVAPPLPDHSRAHAHARVETQGARGGADDGCLGAASEEEQQPGQGCEEGRADLS